MLSQAEAQARGLEACKMISGSESFGASLPVLWSMVAGDVSPASLWELGDTWAQYADKPQSRGADQIRTCIDFVALLRLFEQGGGRIAFIDGPAVKGGGPDAV